jgi:hypothetical protein
MIIGEIVMLPEQSLLNQNTSTSANNSSALDANQLALLQQSTELFFLATCLGKWLLGCQE